MGGRTIRDPVQPSRSMTKPSIAIIGAGLSGALCARRLSDAGWRVEVFDKSRGVGGRMATRRARVLGIDGLELVFEFDHGAPGFSTRPGVPDFEHWRAKAQEAGVIVPWPQGGPDHRWVATPDMPALCRWLLQDIALHTQAPVESLERGPVGWTLHGGEGVPTSCFDAVVMAIPPAQAATLLEPHRRDWAESARAHRMSPCWTLMAVTDAPTDPPCGTGLGALQMIIRQDTKPGRQARPGLASWVAHASAQWSRAHLEAAPEGVQQVLMDELARSVGRVQRWHHAVVHRWRYAQLEGAAQGASFRWDRRIGLGCCGDAWGSGGVEGAWGSAADLCDSILFET